jgi:DNA-directed RNA polymerase subunit M/transcription elongation factor TFIIS
MQNPIEVAREVHARAEHPTTKVILGVFVPHCPECGKGRDSWRIMRISEGGQYHIVKYRCECGAIFKKVEEAE